MSNSREKNEQTKQDLAFDFFRALTKKRQI